MGRELFELELSVRDEFLERVDYMDPDERSMLRRDGPGDLAHEIADGSVPVYTHELMTMAAEDCSLAVDVPELGPAFDGEPTPVNIVAANIYERLLQEVHSAFEDWAAQEVEYEEEADLFRSHIEGGEYGDWEEAYEAFDATFGPEVELYRDTWADEFGG
jgi:hypothetical protein